MARLDAAEAVRYWTLVRARLSGLGLLAMAALFAYFVFYEGMRHSRAIAGIPFFGATGLWLLAFGHPVRAADGLAPLWWRIGLVGCVVVLTAGTLTILG